MARERKIIGVPEVQGIRPYGLGLDCAKDFHAICLLIPVGEKMIRYEWEVTNLPDPLRSAARRIKQLLKRHGVEVEELTYALESTATFHYPVMRTWGGRPCVVNPGLACSFKARKTDRIDAYKLATQHIQGLWPESYVPTTETELLRMLTRTRKRVKSISSRIYNSIKTRLWQWNCIDLNATARDKKVRACIEDLAENRYQAGLPMFEAHAQVPAGVWRILNRLYSLADRSDAEVKQLEVEISATITGALADRLLSCPGVGPVTAAIWLAEVEPATRFPSSAHCVAFCGLDPTPQISGGKKVGTRLRLGNSHIRTALIQAATVSLNGSSLLAANVRSRTCASKMKFVIMARKLCQLLYRCSTQGISYDESKIISHATDRRTGHPT